MWIGQYEPLELFLFVDQSSPIFCPTWKGLWTMLTFRRYSPSKSKIIRNCTEIWTFFGTPKFFGAGLPKVVRTLSPLLHGTSTGEVSWGYSHSPTSPEVIEAHMLHFKPNFRFSWLKFFFGAPVPVGVCARYCSLGQSIAHLKISGCSTP